jgi:hypothetical protein
MSSPITVPFGVLAKGYRITGDLKSGYKASVPYLVSWSDAFTFVDEIMGKTTAVTVGPITFHVPYMFPGSTSARLYPASFDLEPIGASGAPLAPTFGLKPGEFFTFALVTVQFETPQYMQDQQDDPQNLQQLDPANPITVCKQSVKMGGKMVNRKGSGYVWSDNTMLAGDVAVPEKECKLVLEFPKIPFLPWQLIKPFVGTINVNPVLGCDKGTLLLEAPDTDVVGMADGTIGQTLVLEFAQQDHDWNQLRRPDTGQLDFVYTKGNAGNTGQSLFQYSDFLEIFQGLTYVVAG